MRISDLEIIAPDASLITSDSNDWEIVEREYPRLSKQYDGAFVEIGEGEVLRVFFFEGTVPWLDKYVHVPRYTPAQNVARAVAYHVRKRAKRDSHVTRVLFRMWSKGGLIALFPDDIADYQGNISSYQHIGQHGAANLRYIMASSREALPSEYEALKRELESAPYHYNLSVISSLK